MHSRSFMLCAAAGLDAALSNSAPDSPPARQLVKNSDGQLTLSPVKNIGDVFYLLWSEGRPSSKGWKGRINCKSKLKWSSPICSDAGLTISIVLQSICSDCLLRG